MLMHQRQKLVHMTQEVYEKYQLKRLQNLHVLHDS